MRNLSLLVVLSGLFLTACGGGSQQENANHRPAGLVSVFITDNLAEDYSEVWITLYAIEARDSQGQSVLLYEDPEGQVVNLAQLANVGQLLGTQSLPAGQYTQFEIKLDASVNLVDLQGDLTTARFAGAQADKEILVSGSLLVEDDQATSFALDFDLARFSLNANGQIIPAVVYVDNPSDALERTFAEVEGRVIEVIDANTFVVAPASGAVNITVSLHPTAVVVDRDGLPVSAQNFAVGTPVEVYGNVDGNGGQLTAVSVETRPHNEPSDSRQEVEGILLSFDDNSLTLDVKEADFVPDSNTVSVINLPNAVFVRGSQSALAVGQEIEIKGSWDGSLLTADKIEIEGMASRQQDSYTELKGRVVSLEGDILIMSVSRAEPVDVALNTPVQVNIANAWFKQGDASCLDVDVEVEIKGSADVLNDAQFVANVVEVDTHCGATENHELEATALIESLQDDTLVVRIADASESQGSLMADQQVSIALNPQTVEFDLEELAMAQSLGAVVKLEGQLMDGVFSVVEVEQASHGSGANGPALFAK